MPESATVLPFRRKPHEEPVEQESLKLELSDKEKNRLKELGIDVDEDGNVINSAEVIWKRSEVSGTKYKVLRVEREKTEGKIYLVLTADEKEIKRSLNNRFIIKFEKGIKMRID